MSSRRANGGLGPVLILAVFFGAVVFAAGYFAGQGRLAVGPTGGGAPTSRATAGDLRCYFSPDGGCTQAVVDAIDQAKSSVQVQAYSFTSKPIAKALVEAHGRGVKVVAVLDKSQRTAHYSEADFLAHDGIATYIDDRHAIAHNKIMLIDGGTLITGSFNFTNAAERSNAENLLVIRGIPEIYKAYEENFQAHLGHSKVYPGR